MEDFIKKILIDVQVKADSVRTELPNIQKRIDALITDQNRLAKSTGMATKEYQKNAEKLRAAQADYTNATKYIDDTSRAINSENNSLAQNRALLSAVSADYTKLGSPLKENAKLVAQLTEHVKKQETAITQTAKSTDKWRQELIGVGKNLMETQPGGEKVTEVLGKLAGAFNVSGGAAAEAAEGVAVSGEAAAAAGGPITALVAVLAVVVNYFTKLTPIAEKIAQLWSGLSGAFEAVMQSLTGAGFENFFKNVYDAGKKSMELTAMAQEAKRTALNNTVLDTQASARIAELELQMKGHGTSLANQQKLFKQIMDENFRQYSRDLKAAENDFKIAVEKAMNGPKFTNDERRIAKEKGVPYLNEINKKKGLVGGDDAVKEIADAHKRKIEAGQLLTKIKADRQQHNDEMRELRNKAKDAEETINKARQESVLHMLEFEMSAYSKEVSATNQHYQGLIDAQQKYIDDYKQMSHAERDANVGAFKAAKATIRQLNQEHYAALVQQTTKFNLDMEKRVEDANNELVEMNIANIKNDREREAAELKHQEEKKIQELKKEYHNIEEEHTRLGKNLNEATAKLNNARTADDKAFYRQQVDSLQKSFDHQSSLSTINGKQVEAVREKFAQQRITNAKKYADQAQEAENAANVTKTSRSAAFAGDKVALDAQDKQLDDRFRKEREAAILRGESVVELEANYEQSKADLHRAFVQKRVEFEMQALSSLSNAGFSIWANSIKAKAQAQEASLQKSKERELSNTSLTSGQKAIIEAKYDQKLKQSKTKAFKAEQRMNVAKALMDGAQGAVRLWVDPGFPTAVPMTAVLAATTAANIATIMSQKPAYATGGLHYASDGRGAMLSGPGTGTSDSMNARLSNGEAVINARSTGMFGDLLSVINVAGGGRPFGSYWGNAFAAGGTMGNTYLPTRNNPARLSTPLLAAPIIDYDMLAASMTRVNLVLDVKDVNREQANLARAVNGSSH